MGIPFPRTWVCFVLCGSVLGAADSQLQSAITNAPGHDLFTNGSVVQIRVQLRPQDLQSLRHDSRKYVRATIQTPDHVYPEVGIHLKGSVGSFRAVDDKPGLTLEFDKYSPDQRFHGLRKIHLNNSVEDPSFMNEWIASEWFRANGVPAPRVAHAMVELNGRNLGLYVLKEGFTEDFLRLNFKRSDGNLYEPEEGQDVGGRMKHLAGSDTKASERKLRALAEATHEPDLTRRWQHLEKLLEVDHFATFMALEVLLAHRDGYSLARNNFRVYDDPETGKIIFLPHGMDQLFGPVDLPWKPQMAGSVARAFMETQEGRALYEAKFRQLFTQSFNISQLTNRVMQIVTSLGSSVSRSKFKTLQAQELIVQQRIVRRAANLAEQLNRPPPPLLKFSDGVAPLNGWTPHDVSAGVKMEEGRGPDGTLALPIVAGAVTAASWRTTVRLPKGAYRFEGLIRIAAVKPLPYGKNQGAYLRVSGHNPPPTRFTGDSQWKKSELRFTVSDEQEEVELACELRASAGEAWFDRASLRVVQTR